MAAAFHLTSSVLFSYAGFLRMGELVLKHARKLVDRRKARK